jgi:NADPH-dependent curcumin reductase CurA
MPARRLTKRTTKAALELLVGPLSITGLTAYFGLLNIGQPKPGDTVLVSAAAGAVGTMAGQIAKLAGCRVVGTAGGQDKCDWIVRDLGFDAAVDYKAGGVYRALKTVCPNGIDGYFDNTGGPVLEAALSLMNLRGRIVCCGNVSQYDVEKPAPGPMAVPGLVVTKRLRLEGFVVMDFFDQRAEAEARLARWVEEGKIKAIVDVVDGLDKAPQALIGLFEGRNKGKMAVRV